MTFASVLQSFQGFFSRAFWFSRFLPVAIAFLLHAILAQWLFGWVPRDGWIKLLDGTTARTLLVFVALVVVAYAIGPLTGAIRGLLDGTLLPERLHNRLRDERKPRWHRLNEDYDAKTAVLESATTRYKPWKDSLIKAAEAGRLTKTSADKAAISKAREAITALQVKPAPTEAEIDRAGAFLEAALKANAKDIPRDDASAALASSHRIFMDLLDRAITEARHQVDATFRRMLTDDFAYLQPTRFGDAGQVLASYTRNTYNAPLGYIWPRVRLTVIAGEESNGTGTPRHVADRIAQTDFAILLLALWWTVPLVWIPLLAARDGSLLALGAIGLIAPWVGSALYEMAVHAEIEAGTAMGTAIDRYRRETLKQLNLIPPPTLSGERELWAKLADSIERHNAVELHFAPSSAAAGAVS